MSSENHNPNVIRFAQELQAVKENESLSVDDAGQLIDRINKEVSSTDQMAETLAYLIRHFEWTNAASEWLTVEKAKYGS